MDDLVELPARAETRPAVWRSEDRQCSIRSSASGRLWQLAKSCGDHSRQVELLAAAGFRDEGDRIVRIVVEVGTEIRERGIDGLMISSRLAAPRQAHSAALRWRQRWILLSQPITSSMPMIAPSAPWRLRLCQDCSAVSSMVLLDFGWRFPVRRAAQDGDRHRPKVCHPPIRRGRFEAAWTVLDAIGRLY